MNRKAKASLVAAAMAAALAAEAEFNVYRMQLVELVDSDTYRATVQLWPGLVQRIDVRLEDVDTPEHYQPSKKCRAHERALAAAAKDIAAKALKGAEAILLTGVGLGKYAGRVVGDVILVDAKGRETRIADLLLESGLAVEYHGGTKTKDWCAVELPRAPPD